MTSHRRGPWSQAEDAYLVQLVHTQGALNWVRIAQLIGSRSPKQCRERYHQNLKPSLNHEPISPEEGLEIERLVGEMGKRWAEIARRLRGRSDNAVKNWWNGSMNRRRRLVVRRRGSSKDMHDFDESMEPNTFARFSGSVHQPLTLSMDRSYSRHIDPSLPSPSASVISRADSLEGAPSLISDCGSAVSLSPRSRCSPNIELPPIRHRSNPAVYGSPVHATESEGHYKHHSWSGLPTPTAYHSTSKAEPRQSYFDAVISPPQQQLPSAPATPVQLPPMQMAAPPLPKIAKDSRMNLSSLLG